MRWGAVNYYCLGIRCCRHCVVALVLPFQIHAYAQPHSWYAHCVALLPGERFGRSCCYTTFQMEWHIVDWVVLVTIHHRRDTEAGVVQRPLCISTRVPLYRTFSWNCPRLGGRWGHWTWWPGGGGSMQWFFYWAMQYVENYIVISLNTPSCTELYVHATFSCLGHIFRLMSSCFFKLGWGGGHIIWLLLLPRHARCGHVTRWPDVSIVATLHHKRNGLHYGFVCSADYYLIVRTPGLPLASIRKASLGLLATTFR